MTLLVSLQLDGRARTCFVTFDAPTEEPSGGLAIRVGGRWWSIQSCLDMLGDEWRDDLTIDNLHALAVQAKGIDWRRSR